MFSRRSLTAVAFVAALLSPTLVSCSGGNDQPHDDSSSPVAPVTSKPSALPTVPVNNYNPAKVVNKQELQLLSPGKTFTAFECGSIKSHDAKLFPTNARHCTGTIGNSVKVRLVTIVDDNIDDDVSPVRNSGLLADTGGSTMRMPVRFPVSTVYRADGVFAYVKHDPYEKDAKEYPFYNDVKKADRLVLDHGNVTFIVGSTDDIDIKRLFKVANIVMHNFAKQYPNR